MRLLNTTSLKLEEFYGDNIPIYAILSHRWEREEVTFKDMVKGKAEGKIGYAKIVGCCERVSKDGCTYVWIDTCCIDKSSSAELSEAINSMFDWYSKAEICYVYLSDVPNISEENDGDEHFEESSAFRRSKWFSRGWTLQELLAPNDVEFLDQSWQSIGDRSSLSFLLSEIQGISQYHLHSFEEASVAQKMSWMSNRQTTKVEDLAYCMLGIFGVFMPPLYGEGKNAFVRLQLEIMKISDDESIFAWNSTSEDSAMYFKRSLLAQAPSEFRNCSKVVRESFSQTPAYSMTNKGLHITLPMIGLSPEMQIGADHIFEAALNCRLGDREEPVTLLLTPAVSANSHAFTRVYTDCQVSEGGVYQRLPHPDNKNHFDECHTPLFVPEIRTTPRSLDYINATYAPYMKIVMPEELRRFQHSVMFGNDPDCCTWLDIGNGHSRIKISSWRNIWIALVLGPVVDTNSNSSNSVKHWLLGLIAITVAGVKVFLKTIPIATYHGSHSQNQNRAVEESTSADKENDGTRALRRQIMAIVSKETIVRNLVSARIATRAVPEWGKTLRMRLDNSGGPVMTLDFQLNDPSDTWKG